MESTSTHIFHWELRSRIKGCLEFSGSRVVRYECDCGYKIVVVAYEPQQTVDEPSLEDSDAIHR